jgi:serine/threonine-protein kinase RsbW
VKQAIEAVLAAMAALDYPAQDVFRLHVALEEAVINAIRHGNKNDPRKWVRLRFQVTRDQVLVEVKDQGEGFDPRLVPDPRAPENLERPSGRGLLLMRSYVTWLRHSENGTCVTLCRCRSTHPASSPERATP